MIRLLKKCTSVILSAFMIAQVGMIPSTAQPIGDNTPYVNSSEFEIATHTANANYKSVTSLATITPVSSNINATNLSLLGNGNFSNDSLVILNTSGYALPLASPIILDFALDKTREVKSFELGLESIPDDTFSRNLKFNISGKKNSDENFTILFENVSGAYKDNSRILSALETSQQFDVIRLTITELSSTYSENRMWASLTEFAIVANAEDIEEEEVIASPQYDSVTQFSTITASSNVTASETTLARLGDGNFDNPGAGNANLVILNSSGYPVPLPSPIMLDFALDKTREIKSFDLAMESIPGDTWGKYCTYSILGKKKSDAEFTPLVENVKTVLKENPRIFSELATAQEFDVIRLIFTEAYSSYGTMWVSLMEFAINAKLDNLTSKTQISTSAAGGIENSERLYDGIYGATSNVVRILRTPADHSYPVPYEGEPITVDFELTVTSPVKGFEIGFESVAAPDPYNHEYKFDIQGKRKQDATFTTLLSNQTGNRLDKARNEYALENLQYFDTIRINITYLNSSYEGRVMWPVLTEFAIYGVDKSMEVTTPDGNVAFRKPVFANYGAETASNAVDGIKKNAWTATRYPAFIDIDLEANYDISKINVFTTTTGYAQYSIYTSLNGRDYNFYARKTSKDSPNSEGEVYNVQKTAKYVRVHFEYNSAGNSSRIDEIEVFGEPSSQPIETYPEVMVEDFEDSEYNVSVTNQDTYEELQGIVERTVGKAYVDWFKFEIAPNTINTDYDYFELSDDGGKILIKGNNGVSLATGLNYYYKYFLNVHISQVENQVKMPESIVSIGSTPFRRETKLKLRYAYNYCTFSYSMAFWGEEEWRKELDWLALNGVNIVLDLTGQEEVWRRFLGKLGYTTQEAKSYLVGPAYYAWAYMANIYGLGGPIHDSWFGERTELARKNHLAMRKLGMQPILQGYSGMVPLDIKDKQPDARILAQGTWNGSRRPDMLYTDSQSFVDFAEFFYESQKEVYGDVSDFYATDPFHEGGIKGDMSEETVARIVLREMMSFDPNAVWVIQCWTGNPTTGLLNGIKDNKEHTLIVDLWAEKWPSWETRNQFAPSDVAGKPSNEFNETPWIYCMLNNFGGRLGLYGHIENMVTEIPKAFKGTKGWFRGIGIVPEASVNNPVLYDLLFETIWSDTPNDLPEIDLKTWFKNYVTRRYGADSDNAYRAMLILNDTVYNPNIVDKVYTEGAQGSVVNATPSFGNIDRVSISTTYIPYDKHHLELALDFLLKDYDKLKDSPAYLYDLADVTRQVLANTAQEYQRELGAARSSGDLQKYRAAVNKFMTLIDKVDTVLSTQTSFLFGTWLENAKKTAANADDFSKMLYELNAKALVTTWFSYTEGVNGGLVNYSNRQWSGLTSDFYKNRWKLLTDAGDAQLQGGPAVSFNAAKWFEYEWAWVRGLEGQTEPFSTEKDTTVDLKALAQDVLENYALSKIKVEVTPEVPSIDYPTTGMTIATGSEHPVNSGQTEGPASLVLDGNLGTIWHSKYPNEPRANLWVTINVGEPKTVNGLRYTPRQTGTNGIITGYKIEVSTDGGQTFTEVRTGTWASNNSVKLATFEPIENVTHIKLTATNSMSDQSGQNFASAAEIRVTYKDPTGVGSDEFTKLGDMAVEVADGKLSVSQSGVTNYEWYRDGELIGYGTSLNSYYLTEADAGKMIYVKATTPGISGYYLGVYGTPVYSKVQFNLNYVNAPASEEIEVLKGLTIKPIENPANPDGKLFSYWATKEGGEYKRFDFSTPIKEDTTLYAIWENSEATLLGDINLDGKVNLKDALIALKVAKGTKPVSELTIEQFLNGNVVTTGASANVIDKEDAQAILDSITLEKAN